MARLQWALICQRVITDRETNSVSYIDAVEGFSVSSFPFPCPPVCVSTLWCREDPKDRLQVRIRIKAPGGKTLLSFEPDHPYQLPKKRHRLNVVLGGTEIAAPGEYNIIIEQFRAKRWKRERVIPLDITEMAPSPIPQTRTKSRAGVRTRRDRRSNR